MIAHVLVKIYKMMKIAKVFILVWILLNDKKIQLTQSINIYEEIILLEIPFQFLNCHLPYNFPGTFGKICCISGQINKSLSLEISVAMK